MLNLHRNECRHGLSPAVRRLLSSAGPLAWQYPAREAARLVQRLAIYHRRRPEEFVLGAGATAILQTVLAHFARRPDARLFYSAPVFPLLPAMAGALPSEFCRWLPDGSIDLPGLRQRVEQHRGAALVYLSNPDCHGGQMLDQTLLDAWMCEASPRVRFIIDEAYMEFLPEPEAHSLLSRLDALPSSLLVLRTFSKAYGLAGLRVGFAVGRDAGWLAGLQAALAPALNLPGLLAAAEALQNPAWLEHARWLLATARAALCEGLEALQLSPRCSVLNFVLHRLPGEAAFWLAGLAAADVSVCYPINTLPGWCRVSVDSFDGVQRYLQVLRDLLQRRVREG
ncbi:histidinol-phosphate transaminase [Paludibacterium sp. B53371]|uniref:pyridoxal phosphate-dependent aminotransferase n=1 Tax=Paludibacterium sp. B53371 TaxID=2806263 RepID=UPI001C0561CD|nr:aminotransferase class I/II-fold pyridoxal phosphate-dependent enzyme [Paludibacterium sp. B53371]